MDFFQSLVVASPGPYARAFLALLDYANRADEIGVSAVVCRPSVVCPSEASIISEPIAWISFKFYFLGCSGVTICSRSSFDACDSVQNRAMRFFMGVNRFWPIVGLHMI